MTVSELAKIGIEVRLDGDRLVLKGPITDEMVEDIRRNKAVLIAEINGPRGAPSDDPMTPCEACGCNQWHRMLDAGAWWCSSCWPWPADLPPLSMMTVPATDSRGAK